MPAAESEFESVSDNHPWREEVASRVNSYRRRRGRKIEGEYSMHLDFEAATTTPPVVTQAVAERLPDPEVSCDINYFRRTNAAPLPSYEPEAPVIDESGPEMAEVVAPEPSEPVDDPDFDFETPRLPQPEQTSLEEVRWGFATEAPADAEDAGNLIVFPKQPTYQPEPPVATCELAEPVLERPRILDVPEEVVPTVQGPLFATVHLDLEETDEPVAHETRSQIDVPLQVAMVAQRLYGGVIDAMFVLCGFGLFATVFYAIVPKIAMTKAAYAFAFAVPAVFWLVFQYIFLTYAGQTPGMRVANISVVNFEGGRPDQRRRRQRAISMIISVISGGVGYGWALLDPDGLCWHDSISRTYVTQER